LAKKYNLRVVEDAAHSFGCNRNGKRIGVDGDVICFSFDGIKNITSGEGGAVVTADLVLAERIKDARLLGVSRDTDKRYSGRRSWDFDVRHQGFRYHMSDIMAAIGRAQLKRFDELASVRCALAKLYVEGFQGLSKVQLIEMDYDATVPHIFPVFFDSSEMRNTVRSELLRYEIETGVHYKPNHTLSLYNTETDSFPVAERLYSEMLTLPLHASLSEEKINKIINVVKEIIRN